MDDFPGAVSSEKPSIYDGLPKADQMEFHLQLAFHFLWILPCFRTSRRVWREGRGQQWLKCQMRMWRPSAFLILLGGINSSTGIAFHRISLLISLQGLQEQGYLSAQGWWWWWDDHAMPRRGSLTKTVGNQLPQFYLLEKVFISP